MGKSLGEKIRQARLNRNIDIKDLAHQVGIPAQKLFFIEGNAERPTAKQVLAMQAILKTDLT